jgi:hypothetical protein
MPDGEAQWRDFSAAGWTIRTLAERIVLQPIVKRYETPAPVLRAIALGIPIVAIGSTAGMYYQVNPYIVALAECAAMGALFFWASGQLEMTEIEDTPDEEPEPPSEVVQVERAEEVTRPARNSIGIKVLYEPPTGATPEATRRLAQAALSLAQMATDRDSPLEPVSFNGAKARAWWAGEPTFATIQNDWRSKKLAVLDNRGWCYLTGYGRHVLRVFSAQSPTPKTDFANEPATSR